MSWHELLFISAEYYRAGDTPVCWDRAFSGSSEPIGDNGDLWWFPGVEAIENANDALPPRDGDRLRTEAVRFADVYPAANRRSLLKGEIDGLGRRDALLPYIDALKAACDSARGTRDDWLVEAIIVFRCDAGNDYDGEYWSTYEPLGLLDLERVVVLP